MWFNLRLRKRRGCAVLLRIVSWFSTFEERITVVIFSQQSIVLWNQRESRVACIQRTFYTALACTQCRQCFTYLNKHWHNDIKTQSQSMLRIKQVSQWIRRCSQCVRLEIWIGDNMHKSLYKQNISRAGFRWRKCLLMYCWCFSIVRSLCLFADLRRINKNKERGAAERQALESMSVTLHRICVWNGVFSVNCFSINRQL